MKRLIKYATLLASDRAKEEGLESDRQRTKEGEEGWALLMESVGPEAWPGCFRPSRSCRATSVSKFLYDRRIFLSCPVLHAVLVPEWKSCLSAE